MIDSDEAAKLRGLLRHPGWLEVVRPRIVTRIKNTIETMDESFSNDQIRCSISWYKALTWALTNWEQELRAYEHNKRADGEPVEAANPLERS